MSDFVQSIALRFREGTDPQTIADFFRDARGAASAQPGCRAAFAGVDRGISDGQWAGALVALFVSEGAYHQYMASEEHKALGAKYGEFLAGKAATQFLDSEGEAHA